MMVKQVKFSKFSFSKFPKFFENFVVPDEPLHLFAIQLQQINA